jgi:hypothetical protein
MPSQHWARNFTVSDEDLDSLSGFLLEKETPLPITDLARELVERRLQQEADALANKYKDILIYSPALTYKQGQKILFPHLDYAIGSITALRKGNNPAYGNYQVLTVEFATENPPVTRKFAGGYGDHKLNEESEEGLSLPGSNELTADEIMANARDLIIPQVEEKLKKQADLVSVAGQWFPRTLMLDVNEGHLNLAEAILDINEGGPLTTAQILDDIGAIVAKASTDLQVFSLNYAMNEDERFDEVGPVNSVLWFLGRLEPAEVQNAPYLLKYTPVDYEAGLLTPEMTKLEAEIDDEWSNLRTPEQELESVTITLNYAHRRSGTLPLNAKMRQIFPTARRTPRIYVTLVDGQDGEEYAGWVVRQERYVYGLSKLYRKHKLPVGAIMYVETADDVDKIIVNFMAHKARTEYLPLIIPKDGRMTFVYDRRSIGADYDDLMIFGADDLAAVDAMYQDSQKNRKSLSALLHSLVTELSRTSPQGTVHAKTLYSAVNVVRRLPPGPIFAALVTNTDFEHVGNNYWRLSGR